MLLEPVATTCHVDALSYVDHRLSERDDSLLDGYDNLFEEDDSLSDGDSQAQKGLAIMSSGAMSTKASCRGLSITASCSNSRARSSSAWMSMLAMALRILCHKGLFSTAVQG